MDIKATPFSLRTLSFNVWAAPVVGRHQRERVAALLAHVAAERAAGRAYDLLGLQEVFTPQARAALRAGLAARGLPHFAAFASGSDLPLGADGSGCCVASRFPLLETAWRAFSASGRPERLDQFDHQAGKGVGLARVLLPGGAGTADVYVSHFVAQYRDGAADAYACQRALQALEVAAFVRVTRR